MNNPILSICIPTTVDRRDLFTKLYYEFFLQTKDLPVEVIFEEDNKKISVGRKRQILLQRAKGDYVVSFDSDDWPSTDYVSEILKAAEKKPDCIGFLIHMTTNNVNPKLCCHSLRYKVWAEKKDGYDYVRSPGHFNPIKREIALQVGFRDVRYGEDHEYSKKVTPLLNTEVFINKRLFHYRYSNAVPHKFKYGIKR